MDDEEAAMTEPTATAAPLAPAPVTDNETTGRDGEALVAEDLLVEEVSIDGMCGVY
jgi:mycofactocin precursor